MYKLYINDVIRNHGKMSYCVMYRGPVDEKDIRVIFV